MSVTHGVKSWPEFFWPILEGIRTHELRENDRNYQEGDYMWLHEWNPITEEYTGEMQLVKITSITSAEKPCAVSNNGLNSGFVILSIRAGIPFRHYR